LAAEKAFRSERIFQIAEHRGVSPDEILIRIYVCKIYNTSQSGYDNTRPWEIDRRAQG